MTAAARLARRVRTGDSDLLRLAVRTRTARRDAAMRAASRAADKSRVWLTLSGVLGLGGGSRGRRAALRGLLAIGLTSAVVNGPLKLLLRRGRPVSQAPTLVTMPRSFSFPSGHAASAAAFATSVVREWPAVGAPIVGAAAAVAYSRVYTGVHYPSDVVVGAGLGVAAAAVAGTLLRDEPGIPLPAPLAQALPRKAILMSSPSSGAAEQLSEAKQALRAAGIEIVRELEVSDKAQLADVVALPTDQRPLVIAAGGDGTVGAAADELAGTGVVLAILPLGTSNDVARSLGIDPRPVVAARELGDGVVRAIDAGQVLVDGERPRNFVHAATVGFNVRFASLATSSALRRRFCRLTYAVAGVRAMRQHEPFDCELRFDGTTETLRLVQLSIINAPVFGGALDLRVPEARLDDRSLVVIAVEEGSAVRMVLGTLAALVTRRGHAGGVRALRTKELTVHVDKPVDVALDGEIVATLPADFVVAAEALRVVTPRLKNDRA